MDTDPTFLHIRKITGELESFDRIKLVITSVLKYQHWLPVRSGINFRILVPVYKCIYRLAPNYLVDIVQRLHYTTLLNTRLNVIQIG